MPYPPTVPPATRTDASVMATNHPSDHNLISEALTEILNHMAALEARVYPIGSIMMWGSGLPPGDHEFCRGQAVSRSTYPEVFSIIGTSYGVGDGSTTFNLPEFRGRVPAGYWPGGAYATSLGQAFGDAHAQLISHRHSGTTYGSDRSLDSGPAGGHVHTPSPGGENFITNGFGGVSAGIADTGTAFMFDTLTSAAPDHIHTVPDHLHPFDTDFEGLLVDGTNENLQPSLTVNFVMRMH